MYVAHERKTAPLMRQSFPFFPVPGDQTIPWACMASTTFSNPAMLAPTT